MNFLSFDFFVTLEYWLVFAGIVVVYRLLDRTRRLLPYAALLISLGMILALPRISIVGVSVLLAATVGTYLVAILLNGDHGPKTRRSRMAVAATWVVLIVVLLALCKYHTVQDFGPVRSILRRFGLSDYFFIVGISYICFRLIHVVIESYNKRLENLSLLTFLNYAFFFPAFVSGPIHRHNEFAEQWCQQSLRPDYGEIAQGIRRLLHGLFKKIVLGGLLVPYTLSVVSQADTVTVWGVVLGIYAQTIYFYLDFSGYSDIAIGAARILGITLPENFNQPFLKPNIQQLWANWHMSLTSWLTDYVYWPVVRAGRKTALLNRRPVTLSNIGIILTFAVCGLWHGEGLSFLLWGIYHGVGIAIVNMYRTTKRKARSPRFRRYFGSRTSKAIGVFVTFNFFALGIVLFSLDFSGIQVLFQTLSM